MWVGLMNVLSFLSEIHPRGIDLSTEEGRFYAQKGVFFLKMFGYRKVQKYDFNEYVFGAFSSNLNEEIIYEVNRNKVKDPRSVAIPDKDIDDTVKGKMKELMGKDRKFLEGLSTYVLLSQRVKVEELKTEFETLKPSLKEGYDEIVQNWRRFFE